MPIMFFVILLVVSLLFVVCGALSVVAPENALMRDRRFLHRVKLISGDKLAAPVRRRAIVVEHVQGFVFLILGLFLLGYSGVEISRASASEKDAIDFTSAVEALVAAEGLGVDTTESRPPVELRIVSARYGAGDTWINVTEQCREAITNNTLEIRASNAIGGDPLFGVAKTLNLEYELGGEHKTAALREGMTFRIPADPLSPLNTIATAERLVALAEACPAEVGFYGKNFTTGKTVQYRPAQPACLASIVKLFSLLEVMRQVDEGAVDLFAPITIHREKGQETCTISEALDKMIGVSDNEATTALAELVGYDEINALPKKSGIGGLSDQILPGPGLLEKALDKRVYRLRVLQESDMLPQHGTAQSIVRYLELLHEHELVNEEISRKVLEVLDRNPKYFAPHATPGNSKSGGKGGSISWIRPFRPAYNMLGWGILIRSEDAALGFCLWSEWFPASMSQEEQREWCFGLSDCIVNILLLPAREDMNE